jgi:hypothetical protein
MRHAPVTTTGFFTGDSEGLASAGSDFTPRFSQPHGSDPSSAFFGVGPWARGPVVRTRAPLRNPELPPPAAPRRRATGIQRAAASPTRTLSGSEHPSLISC